MAKKNAKTGPPAAKPVAKAPATPAKGKQGKQSKKG